MKGYISFGLDLLREKGHDTILLKAMGRAINKTVAIGERQIVRGDLSCNIFDGYFAWKQTWWCSLIFQKVLWSILSWLTHCS
jgi:hypothetical protein